jgi:hypothetical protein
MPASDLVREGFDEVRSRSLTGGRRARFSARPTIPTSRVRTGCRAVWTNRPRARTRTSSGPEGLLPGALVPPGWDSHPLA